MTKKVVNIKTLYDNNQTKLFNVLLYEYELQRLNELYKLLYEMELKNYFLRPDEAFSTGIKTAWILWDIQRIYANMELLDKKVVDINEVKTSLFNDFIHRNVYNKFVCFIILEIYRKNFTDEESKLFLTFIMEKEIKEEIKFNNKYLMGFDYPVIYPHQLLNGTEIIPLYIGNLFINISDIVKKLDENICSEETRKIFTNNLIDAMDFPEKTDNYEFFIVSEMLNRVNQKSINKNVKVASEPSIQLIKKYHSSNK